MIFGAITNILGSVVKGYFETKKEKAKQKLLQVQAETKIMEKKVSGGKLIGIWKWQKQVTIRGKTNGSQ